MLGLACTPAPSGEDDSGADTGTEEGDGKEDEEGSTGEGEESEGDEPGDSTSTSTGGSTTSGGTSTSTGSTTSGDDTTSSGTTSSGTTEGDTTTGDTTSGTTMDTTTTESGEETGPTIDFATQVQPIFSSNCATPGCHGQGAPRVMLVEGMAYGNIVDQPSSAGPDYIEPGSPDDSYLYSKITGAPGAGQRMPVGGMLSEADIQTIADWILAGAPE